MASKFHIDSKISADAMNQETSNSNVPNVTNSLFKDQKRVIKKMIVMDTSKLKGLGIESTIKNAMSKLEKGKHKKQEQPTLMSSTFADAAIKSEFETKIASTKPTDSVIKQAVRPIIAVLKPSTSMTEPVPVHQSNRVVQLIRPSIPSSASVDNAVYQSVKLVAPVPVTKKVVPSTAVPASSTDRDQPMIIPSKSIIPIITSQHNGPIQNDLENSQLCNSKIVPSQTATGSTNNPLIKADSTVPSVANDGKKIKILSDVSLNDAKAKILEIDKLSSKNLKLTNVIKGTDTGPTNSTVHTSDSGNHPAIQPYSRPVPVKVEPHKVSNYEFTNVIKGMNVGQARSTVFTTNTTSQPPLSQCTTAKPFKSEIKLISGKRFKLANVIEEMDEGTSKPTSQVSNSTNRPVRSFSTSSITVKTGDKLFSTKNLRFTNVIEAVDKTKFTTQPVKPLCTSSMFAKTENEKFPPKIINFCNITEGNTAKSTVHNDDAIKQPARSSHTTSKPAKPGSDNSSSMNQHCTNVNATKSSTAYFSNFASKPVMSQYSPSVLKKSEIEEIKPNDVNLPNVKGTKEIPLQVVGKTSIFKVKTGMSTESTSASTEVSIKQLTTSDENIEIIMPAKQKYLTKRNRGGLNVPTTANDANRACRDDLWATNNPRTYARHNIKRLLSDKIIKKSRSQDESVQNVLCKVENEQTSELSLHIERNKSESKSEAHGDATPTDCDLKPDKILPVESKSVCNEPISSISAFKPADDPVASKDAITHSETATKNNFYGFSIDEVNESASILNQIKALLSRQRRKEIAPVICKDLKVSHAKDVRTVGCAKSGWILNYETGVLEEPITKDVTMVLSQQDVPPPNTEMNSKIVATLSPQSTTVNESTPKKRILPGVMVTAEHPNQISENSPIPSNVSVIEDADDEISDIDLVHRSKAKWTGSAITPAVKTRRAILKSVELHRKAFMSTTTDDESELSFCVRPPRPKLRKSRHKQTVEQFNIQQNAHASLLKRFTQTDLDHDNLDDEAMVYFIDGVMDRIEMLENQVKCCFDPQNRSQLNVETINLPEKSVLSTHAEFVTEKCESVKPSEIVAESVELVKPIKTHNEPVTEKSESVQSSEMITENVDTHTESVTEKSESVKPSEIVAESVELVKPIKTHTEPVTEKSESVQSSEMITENVDTHTESVTEKSESVKPSEIVAESVELVKPIKTHTEPVTEKSESVQSSEMITENVDTHTESVTEKSASMKSSEMVTVNNELVKPSESSSDVTTSLDCVVSFEPQLKHPNLAIDVETAEDQPILHEVTIQEDTFLVTAYNDQRDKIKHQPLNVKLEKETSPKPTCSRNSSRINKTTKSIKRKKRKAKSLVEMLAQHIDKDTLKSVILAHAKQKCDFSSSQDSDSETDSDGRGDEVSDVVSQIFRTVCTVDLCDDDDETLHTDVLQYLNDNESNEIESVQNLVSASPKNVDSLQKLDTTLEESNHVQPSLKSSDEKPKKVKIQKSEAPEIQNTDTISNADVTISSEKTTQDPTKEKVISSPVHASNISKEPHHTTKNSQIPLENVSYTTSADPQNEEILTGLPDASVIETESNDPTIFNDFDNEIEMFDAAIDVKVCAPTVTSDTSKINGMDSTSADTKTEKTVLKLRPFEEIAGRSKKKSENEFPKSASNKLSFEESLTKTDSMMLDSNRKSKRTRKVPKLKSVDIAKKKKSEHSIDANENNSQLQDMSFVNKTTTIMQQPTNDKVKLSSVSVNDDSAVGAIKIKIKFEKTSEEQSPECGAAPIVKSEKLNGVTKPSRSRKRKLDVSQATETVPTTTPIQHESTQKRPIFDYFESPQILTTKRARKSKSYVDDDIRNEDVPPKAQSSNQRSSKRKSNTSKNIEGNVRPKLESNVQDVAEEANYCKETTPTEPVEQIADAEVQEIVKVSLTPTKTGRGIKPPVLAPINTADRYVCGNCKEEVVAKSWTKHIKTHYGLTWRVDVDPPIDMDNIHTMASKVLNFTKKANIRYLKCQKCNVEKKSALGYLSHVEVCGLTPEEIKSKLVKCDYCPSMIRSCSMKIHQTFCSGLKRLLDKEMDTTKKVESSEECFNDIGRAVRRSAQKAMSSFKDLGKPPEAKIEDYVERVRKISNKQLRMLRQQLKENNSVECVRQGCTFTADDMVSILKHFNSCVLIDGETFYCNRCEYGPDTRAVIEEHIQSTHSLGVIEAIDEKDFTESDDEAEVGEESSESEGESGDDESLEKDDEQCDYDDDDEDDGWNTKGYKKKRQRDWAHNEVMLNSCLDRKVLADHASLLKSYSGGAYFQPTLEWTQDFRDKHFSSKDLLPFATPNSFSVLNSSSTDLYIPRVSISNKYLVKDVRKYKKHYGSTQINKTEKWKALKRFEATKEKDSIVLFAGGPVLSLAWLPVPDDHLSQILAVCCRTDANDDILLNNTRPTKCLIQIWNFDKLKNGQLRHAQTPYLLYSIAYDHGPVIQMEFCPSGGFTEDRLGLLAVSSYDGHVDILALPKNFTCDNSKIENLVFTMEPSLTLCCELNQPLNVLLTKLVWSQSKGHTKLAGGYSNGLVAIWNLKNLQSPACSKTNGIPTLLPTDLFFAGNKTIKLLEFHQDEKNEARWLIAGTHDRKVKFFDTHNVYLEISTTVAHSRIVAGCWPIHWTAFLFGIDNAYSLKVSGIVVKQPLDIGCRTSTFYSCIGSTCDISFNNWLNSYVFVTSYGDIHVGYVRQMISGFAETRRQRSILGYTDVVNINQSICNEGDVIATALDDQQPSTSSASALEQTNDISYPSTNGIVFCDFENPLPAITSPSYDKIRKPPMDTYNMVKVNRILFNPNVSAYKLYALGYESGFVRVNQLLSK